MDGENCRGVCFLQCRTLAAAALLMQGRRSFGPMRDSEISGDGEERGREKFSTEMPGKWTEMPVWGLILGWKHLLRLG